ncbi:BRO1 domain-containing protein BROX [Mytilus coruscus]|uniref:BRO1 domain-containing protein BROX n=1 Tax=Mytilus coruscus TaxID=42192 RepID=A0A6J8A2K6_MYTCO|nr:BRO1 domain-containing protein BROX [Mytilus coruscus]
MSYWFHRNPLKATANLTFELRGVSTDEKTRRIFNELRQTRNKLLELLPDPNHDKSSIDKATTDYFSLLLGLIQPFDEGENKLRKALKFKWTNSLLGNVTQEQWDTAFEAAHMAINVALWYTKHAAKLAAKETPDMEEAKEVHTCLRVAAGIFTYAKDELVGKLAGNSTDNAVDTEGRIMEAYINQCTAEAQEVTIARAIELKHQPSLVAALAYETAQMYQRADDALNSLDEKIVGKWRKYFQLKSAFYTSTAYSYNGEALLAEDKCGEGNKGPTRGSEIISESRTIMQGFGPILKRTLEKCERENGMIYHHKVPYDPPQLELKATYGLVSPEEFKSIALSPLWTKDVYEKMDAKMAPKEENEKKADKDKDKKELPPVKEKETPMSEKDPGTLSGCSVS